MTHAKQQRDTPQAVHYIIERSRPRRLPERPFEYVAEFVELSEEEYGAAGAPSDWPALKAAIEQANREGLPLVLDGIGHCYRSPRFLQVLSKADWIVCDRITKENIPTLIQEAAEIAGRIGSGVRARPRSPIFRGASGWRAPAGSIGSRAVGSALSERRLVSAKPTPVSVRCYASINNSARTNHCESGPNGSTRRVCGPPEAVRSR